MIAEDIEFQISQYADGTLSAADRQVVDELLAVDPQARKVLADYRRIDAHLAARNRGPSVQWNRLAGYLSARVVEQAEKQTAPLVAGRIGSWSTRLRIAAAILVAGTAWMIIPHRNAVRPTPPAVVVPNASVTGPQAELAKGPAVSDVEVGPSQLARSAERTRYGEDVIVGHPSKIVISGLTPLSKRDSHLH